MDFLTGAHILQRLTDLDVLLDSSYRLQYLADFMAQLREQSAEVLDPSHLLVCTHRKLHRTVLADRA